jgi:5-methyltetrahydropteroyltriglutamate--homocysteine methyltransferase
MSESSVPGYPRIGRSRELKKLIESFWAGKIPAEELERGAQELRRVHWEHQLRAGVSRIPVGDSSFYDPMLDLSVLLGWIPERFETAVRSERGLSPSDRFGRYFAMARGAQGIPAMEMTKWFDTNYHYIVPEISGPPRLAEEDSDTLLALLREAQPMVGQRAKPVLVGPYTFLRLARIADGRPFEHHLEQLGTVYGELLARLAGAGAEWIQLDEPALVYSGPIRAEAVLVRAYKTLMDGLRSGPRPARVLLQTYFGSVWDRRSLLETLPVDGIGIDLVRGPENWRFLEDPPPAAPAQGVRLLSERTWVAGVLDGRNVWRADLDALMGRLARCGRAFGPRLWIGTSCSLQFLPYTVAAETALDPEVRPWFAFAEERLQELEILRRGLTEGPQVVRAELDEASRILGQRAKSARTTNPEVRARVSSIGEDAFRRSTGFSERYAAQMRAFNLPLLPSTTIGSFPQTPEVRQARSRFKTGKLTSEAYQEYVRGEIEKVIRLQEEIGLDVLVHGEFERSDMVDYFGEQLHGMAVTEHGWVQSYGTRCVRPPIIYGDVARRGPMTVRESRLAQLLTRKPIKGMLTGPVTILNWSFPREDLSRSDVAFQIALALRDETCDLERAGIRMIQIDEPAFREGLPLREEAREAYLNWAVRSFRLASSGVGLETQIHTHMCYSEFNEIISWIAAMDADVISIENSRSSGDLLQAFRDFSYSNGIGPGVYDIHSPRVPTVEEAEALIRRSMEVLSPKLLWVNPDCGLKTRAYEEAVPSLKNMVAAARRVRSSLAAAAG